MTDLAVETDALTVRFGGLTAVDGVDLRVATGHRRAIIGPNGAGKTTLFNLIAGQVRPTSGTVKLHGRDVTGLPVQARTRAGVARTFQITNLFDELTVTDNVRLAVAGADPKVRRTFWRPLHRFPHIEARVDDLLEQWDLAAVRDERPIALSYGQQRILEIVLATAGQQRVLLLDEPTAGVSKSEAENLVDTIDALPRDLTIILVEHDMDVAFRIADEITVMVNGEELVTGPPDTIRGDERVVEAYLGRDESDAA